MNRIVVVLLSLLAVAAVGCAKSYPDPGVATSEVLSRYAQPAAYVPETVRLVTRVDYVDEKNNKRVVGQEMIVSAGAPQNLRITVSAFDKALSTLVSDGTGFALMDVGQNVFVTGRATPENIAMILPVYLSAADLYRVVTGGFPIEGLAEGALDAQEVAWDAKLGGYCTSFAMAGGGTERICRSWPEGDIFRITMETERGTEYVYEASGFHGYEAGGATLRYPDEVIFRLPLQKTDVRLRVESRDLDVEFSPMVFRLNPPAGTRMVFLDAQGQPQNAAPETPAE